MLESRDKTEDGDLGKCSGGAFTTRSSSVMGSVALGIVSLAWQHRCLVVII